MELNKKIILASKAAGGKDYFKDFLLGKGYKTSTSHTTRPMRDGEIDGVTYNFISKETFEMGISIDAFFECKEFNGWMYGTSNSEVEDANVFIFTPSGIKDLPESFVNDSVIVYFDIPYKDRLDRLNNRSDSDAIGRRMSADCVDFMTFDEYDIRVKNPKFNSENLLKEIILHSNM